MDPDGTPGLLTVVISGGHWGQVSVDGRRIQNAPFTDQEIPAGTREIRVTNTEAGIDFVQTVDVMNGQLVRVVVPEEFDTEEFDPFDFEDLPEEAPPSQPTPWGEVEDVQQIPSETEGERRPPRGSKKR